MSEPIDFRADVVNTYAGLLSLYLGLMELRESVSSAQGAEWFLSVRARSAGLPDLTPSEDRALGLLIRDRVRHDNRVRGGQKRIESVAFVDKGKSKLTFAVEYSDGVTATATAFREHSLRRDNSWTRGDGWPDVPFEMAARAEARSKRESAERTTT